MAKHSRKVKQRPCLVKLKSNQKIDLLEWGVKVVVNIVNNNSEIVHCTKIFLARRSSADRN